MISAEYHVDEKSVLKTFSNFVVIQRSNYEEEASYAVYFNESSIPLLETALNHLISIRDKTYEEEVVDTDSEFETEREKRVFGEDS